MGLTGPMRRDDSSTLRAASLLAAVLLAILCGLVATTGVSQQTFEWVAPSAVYGSGLERDAAWLRVIIGIDDLFIAAYVTATLVLANRLARFGWSATTVTIAALGLAAGVLDLHENHELLALIRWVEGGGTAPADTIVARSELSQLKWMLGHLAFVLVGACWSGRGTLDRVLVVSLVFVQLPLGAATWALADPSSIAIATWARYVSFLAGFATIAWLHRDITPTRRALDDVDARDAPA